MAPQCLSTAVLAATCYSALCCESSPPRQDPAMYHPLPDRHLPLDVASLTPQSELYSVSEVRHSVEAEQNLILVSVLSMAMDQMSMAVDRHRVPASPRESHVERADGRAAAARPG